MLRTFRLLRVLKLVRFMPALRRQLVVLMKTMDNVATFCMLLMLFIFIFRWAGCPGAVLPPRGYVVRARPAHRSAHCSAPFVEAPSLVLCSDFIGWPSVCWQALWDPRVGSALQARSRVGGWAGPPDGWMRICAPRKSGKEWGQPSPAMC